MESQADPRERTLEKIWRRIEEDDAFARADFGEALGRADASESKVLFTAFLAERLDIFAYWHLFLVPHLCTVDGFVEMVQMYAERIVADVRQVPVDWRLKGAARVSHWKGMALKRARTLGAASVPPIPTDSARAIIGRWLKKQGLKHEAGAQRFGFNSTVLSALKRGTALKEHTCGADIVRRVAQTIGCRPEQLDAEYPKRISTQ
jgi:hypothetical protein